MLCGKQQISGEGGRGGTAPREKAPAGTSAHVHPMGGSASKKGFWVERHDAHVWWLNPGGLFSFLFFFFSSSFFFFFKWRYLQQVNTSDRTSAEAFWNAARCFWGSPAASTALWINILVLPNVSPGLPVFFLFYFPSFSAFILVVVVAGLGGLQTKKKKRTLWRVSQDFTTPLAGCV